MGWYFFAPSTLAGSTVLVPSGDTTGATDTPRIKAALATPGGVILSAGTFYYNATLTVPANGRLNGVTWGVSALNAASPFTFDASAAMINVTGAHADIGNFIHQGGPSATFGSNPAGNFIQLQPGAQYTNIHDMGMYYQNGWEIEYVGGAGATNIIGTMIRTLQRFQNKQGIHLKGSSASTWNGQVQITDIQAGQLSGDSMLLEDIQDISIKGYNDSIVGASAAAAALHLKGFCTGINIVNADLGQFPNTGGNIPTAPTVLIEDSANGGPNDVTIFGVAQQGGPTGTVLIQNPNAQAMTRIRLYMRIAQSQGHGFSNTATSGFDICLYDGSFSTDGIQAGTFYDISWTGASSGKVKRVHFGTAQGAAGNAVTSVANFTGAGQVEFDDNEIGNALGWTFANTFTTQPKFARRNKGWNPAGAVVIAVPGSGSATAGRPFDMDFYISAGASTCSCVVSGGGPTVVVPPANTQPFLLSIPAGQTFTPTYANAPTWVVEGY